MGAIRVGCLAQEHLDYWLGGARDCTSNLRVAPQLALSLGLARKHLLTNLLSPVKPVNTLHKYVTYLRKLVLSFFL